MSVALGLDSRMSGTYSLPTPSSLSPVCIRMGYITHPIQHAPSPPARKGPMTATTTAASLANSRQILNPTISSLDSNIPKRRLHLLCQSALARLRIYLGMLEEKKAIKQTFVALTKIPTSFSIWLGLCNTACFSNIAVDRPEVSATDE